MPEGLEYASILKDGTRVAAGSRKRWITPQDDNHGFARWVWDNAEELAELGPGRHWGEWWGHGIQRHYGRDRKFFSLFNVDKWADSRPECCSVVPVLARGDGSELNSLVEAALMDLRVLGSAAAAGFMHPEGVVIYHHAASELFKVTLDGGDEAKTLAYKGVLRHGMRVVNTGLENVGPAPVGLSQFITEPVAVAA